MSITYAITTPHDPGATAIWRDMRLVVLLALLLLMVGMGLGMSGMTLGSQRRPPPAAPVDAGPVGG